MIVYHTAPHFLAKTHAFQKIDCALRKANLFTLRGRVAMRNNDTEQRRRRPMVVFVRNIAVTVFVLGVVAYSVANDFKTIGSGKNNDIQSWTTQHRTGRTRRLGPKRKRVATRCRTNPVVGNHIGGEKLEASRFGITSVAELRKHQEVDRDLKFSGKRIGEKNKIIRILWLWRLHQEQGKGRIERCFD
jgi:hypothetical protein